MRRTIKIFESLLAVLVMFSCTGTKKATNSTKNQAVSVAYDMTYFHTSEYSTFLSLYKIQKDTVLESLDSGFCFINGHLFIRDSQNKYSGELFDRFRRYKRWPHIIIPELRIYNSIEDGIIHERIPCGTYNVILIANPYFPIHFRHTFKDRHSYSIDFYLGYTAIQ